MDSASKKVLKRAGELSGDDPLLDSVSRAILHHMYTSADAANAYISSGLPALVSDWKRFASVAAVVAGLPVDSFMGRKDLFAGCELSLEDIVYDWGQDGSDSEDSNENEDALTVPSSPRVVNASSDSDNLTRRNPPSPHDWISLIRGTSILILEGYDSYVDSRKKYESTRRVSETPQPSSQCEPLDTFEPFVIGGRPEIFSGDSSYSSSDDDESFQSMLYAGGGSSSRDAQGSVDPSFYPLVGDTVMAKYYGDHHAFRGQQCMAVVVGDNGDDTVTVQWQDGDNSGRTVDVSMLTKEHRSALNYNGTKPKLMKLLLKHAIPANSMRMASALIADAPDLLKQDDISEHTAVTMAVACDVDLELLAFLVDAGCDINASGPVGTPAQMVARTESPRKLYCLLSRLANLDGIVAEHCPPSVGRIVKAYRTLGIDEMRREMEAVMSREAAAQVSQDSKSLSEEVRSPKRRKRSSSETNPLSSSSSSSRSMSVKPTSPAPVFMLDVSEQLDFVNSMIRNLAVLLNAVTPKKSLCRILLRRLLSLLLYLIKSHPIGKVEDYPHKSIEKNAMKEFVPIIRLLPQLMASQFLDIVKLSLDVASAIVNVSVFNYRPCVANGLKRLGKQISEIANDCVQDKCTVKSCCSSIKQLQSSFRSASAKCAARKRNKLKNTKSKVKNKRKRNQGGCTSTSEDHRSRCITEIVALIENGQDEGVKYLLESLLKGFGPYFASCGQSSSKGDSSRDIETELLLPLGVGEFIFHRIGSALYKYMKMRGSRALYNCFTKSNLAQANRKHVATAYLLMMCQQCISMFHDLKVESLVSLSDESPSERRRTSGICMIKIPMSIEFCEIRLNESKHGRSRRSSMIRRRRKGSLLAGPTCHLHVPPLLPLWALKMRIKLLCVGVGSEEYTSYCRRLVGSTIMDRSKESQDNYTRYKVIKYNPQLGSHTVQQVESEKGETEKTTLTTATTTAGTTSSSSDEGTKEMLLHARDYYVIEQPLEKLTDKSMSSCASKNMITTSKANAFTPSESSSESSSSSATKIHLWQRVLSPFYNGSRLSKKLFPGTIVSLKPSRASAATSVVVSFDDGDRCDVGVEHIQELPLLESSQIPSGTHVDVRLQENTWYPARIDKTQDFNAGLAGVVFEEGHSETVAFGNIRLRQRRSSSGRFSRESRVRFNPNKATESPDDSNSPLHQLFLERHMQEFSRFLSNSRSSSMNSSSSTICGTIACREETKTDYTIVTDDGIVHNKINCSDIFACSHKAHDFSPPLNHSSNFDTARTIPNVFDALDTGQKHTPGRISLGGQTDSSTSLQETNMSSKLPVLQSFPDIGVRLSWGTGSSKDQLYKNLRKYPDNMTCVKCFRDMAKRAGHKFSPWNSHSRINFSLDFHTNVSSNDSEISSIESNESEPKNSTKTLENLTYRALQQKAKLSGIRSNQRKTELIKALRKTLNEQESSKKHTADTSVVSKKACVAVAKLNGRKPKVAVDSTGSISEVASEVHIEDLHLAGSCREIDGIQAGFSSHLKDIVKMLTLLSQHTSASVDDSLSSLHRFMVSPFLTYLMNSQLEKSLLIASQSTPKWCQVVCHAAPFLIALKTRYDFLKATAFGPSRTIAWLQDKNRTLQRARAAQLEAEQSASRALAANDELAQMEAARAAAAAADELNKVERRCHVGKLKCDIGKVRRDMPHLMKDAEELMSIHGSSKTSLEVQFQGESGFGRGVTQGFYSSICNVLQSAEENSKVRMWALGGTESSNAKSESYNRIVGSERGLFPCSWSRTEMSTQTSDTEQQSRRKILNRFRFLGRLMGTALCDGFVAPLPIATEFFQLLLGEKLDLASASSLVEGDGGFMAGLAQVSKHITHIRREAVEKGISPTSAEEELMNLKDSKLAEKFGNSFFTKQNRKNGPSTYISVKTWLSVMDLRFEDPVYKSPSNILENLPKSTIHQKLESQKPKLSWRLSSSSSTNTHGVGKHTQFHESGIVGSARSGTSKLIAILRRKLMVAKAKGDRTLIESLSRKLASKQQQILQQEAQEEQYKQYNAFDLSKDKVTRKRSRISDALDIQDQSKKRKPNPLMAYSVTDQSSVPGASSAAVSKKSIQDIFDASIRGNYSMVLSSYAQPQQQDFDGAQALQKILMENRKAKPANIRKDAELCVGGEYLNVVPANLVTYTSLIEDRWFGEGVRLQLKAFREGLEEVISLDSLRIFSAAELKTLFCGNAEVIWDEKTLTNDILIPTGSISRDDKLFRFLVAELVAMSNNDRIQFLEFTTAIPRLIPGTKISVARQYSKTPMNLPTARTCSYQLNLPNYKTQAELGEKLRGAVANGLQSGFHENSSTRIRGISIHTPEASAELQRPTSPALSSSSSSTTSSGNDTSSSVSHLHTMAMNAIGYKLDFSTNDIGAILAVQCTQSFHSWQWCQGIVHSYDESKGHYIHYLEDDDMQWHKLERHRYHITNPPTIERAREILNATLKRTQDGRKKGDKETEDA